MAKKTAKLQVMVEPKLYNKLTREAVKFGESKSNIIRRLIVTWLEGRK